MVRLQKFLADAGVASRRAAEKLISDGQVRVNGSPVRVLGSKVDPAHDQVTVGGKLVREKRKLYVALHKPPGCVCSRNDERGRPTIYQLLPAEWKNLYSVGRLDYDTEGLIFLTNDGEFALRLTHPRYGIRKRYVVNFEGPADKTTMEKFIHGVWHDGEKLKAERARLAGRGVAELELAEGKNREVRRLFESQNLTVRRLQRMQIGKIRLGELKSGRWRALTDTEIKTLLS